jgi:DNA topoisomerase-1
MPGLTAKVFRTYNASWTMSELLKGLSKDPRSRGSVAEKVKLYNDCNREVAILCNHKRTVGAGHEQQMQKLGDRVSLAIFGLLDGTLTPIRSRAFGISSGGQRR